MLIEHLERLLGEGELIRVSICAVSTFSVDNYSNSGDTEFDIKFIILDLPKTMHLTEFALDSLIRVGGHRSHTFKISEFFAPINLIKIGGKLYVVNL